MPVPWEALIPFGEPTVSLLFRLLSLFLFACFVLFLLVLFLWIRKEQKQKPGVETTVVLGINQEVGEMGNVQTSEWRRKETRNGRKK